MRRRGLNLRLLLGLLAILAAAGVAVALTIGGSSASQAPSKLASSEFHAEGVLSPPRPAPPLALRNDLGQPVDIASYRGKAVLVTFLYTHCPDVCPLIASNLGVAVRRLGPEGKNVRVLAVSVDPKGDTQAATRAFVARRRLPSEFHFLIGSRRELRRVWRAYH